MGARDRIRKYRSTGGAADLVRVEVLVPKSGKARILAEAAALRAEHRERNEALQAQVERAIALYGPRATDNIDLSKLNDPADQARAVARCLLEKGDARAFVLALRLKRLADGGDPYGTD
jgi:hypothetical protein